MKAPTIVSAALVFITIASLGYGYVQQEGRRDLLSEVQTWKLQAEEANKRAAMAESEARRQEAVAKEQRMVAEVAMKRAQQATADCLKQRKR